MYLGKVVTRQGSRQQQQGQAEQEQRVGQGQGQKQQHLRAGERGKLQPVLVVRVGLRGRGRGASRRWHYLALRPAVRWQVELWKVVLLLARLASLKLSKEGREPTFRVGGFQLAGPLTLVPGYSRLLTWQAVGPRTWRRRRVERKGARRTSTCRTSTAREGVRRGGRG